MISSYEHLGIKYALAGTSDLDEMAVLLGTVFAADDPLARALGVTPAEFEGLVRHFCSGAAVDGLAIMARRSYTGEMVGALLAEDGSSGPSCGTARLSPKLDPVFDLLGGLDAEYRQGRSMAAGTCVHFLFLGVAQPFGGREVGHQLVACCLDNAMRRGYRLAVGEATHSASQHILRKKGFVERVRRSYQEYRFKGKAVFASIQGHSGPILMDRALA